MSVVEIDHNELIDLVRQTREPYTTMVMGKANADWFAALAEAQAAVVTVGKDGDNKQANYSYATAENMIRGSRGPMAEAGLAFFSTWSTIPVSEGDVADNPRIGNQTVGAVVTMHWVLSHEAGGYVSGTADMVAICSPRRPPDKAVAATLTYMRGFILRDLLNMDRLDEPSGAIDQRDDESQRGGREPDRRTPEQVQQDEEEATALAETRRQFEADATELRARVIKLATELEEKTHQGFQLQRSAAGVSQKGRLSLGDLKKFSEWADRQLEQADGHSQEREPGEDDEDDVPDFAVPAVAAEDVDPETGEVES